MKILHKRILAALIDHFLYALMLGILQYHFGKIINNAIVLFLLPFCCKDLVFRNASIGKMIMGIAVFDENWLPPQIKKTIVRTGITLTVGYALAWKAFFVDKDYIAIWDFEYKHTKTRVIDKKILKKLRLENENDSIKITDAYNEYLRELYVK